MQTFSFLTTRNSYLDLVISNDDSFITHSTANENDTFSDHFPISIEIAANARRKERNSKIFSFCTCDFKGLSKIMIEQPFQPYCYSNINVNTKLWYEGVNTKLWSNIQKTESCPMGCPRNISFLD